MKVSVHLGAKITAEGDLQLEGQDLGSFVEEYCGDLDYEYWLTVRAVDLNDVLISLRHDYPETVSPPQASASSTGTQILVALRRLIQQGLCESDSAVHHWFESRGIPSEFLSY